MPTTNLGRVAIVPQGAYSAAVEYKKLDLVNGIGGAYLYVNDTPSTGTALTDTDYWQNLVGNGITSILRTTGDGSPGTTDTYTITYTDATTATFTVYNGQDYLQDMPLTWAELRNMARQGNTDKYFQVGDQFTVQSTPYTSIIFNLVEIGSSTSPNTVASDPDYYTNFPNAKPLVLHMLHVIYGRPFDAPEMLWANTGAAPLPAGTYNFTLYKGANGGQTGEDGTYQFTTAQPIPVGGGFRHSQVGLSKSPDTLYVPANIIGNHITTYNAARVAIESGLTVSAGSGGTALGTASKDSANIINLVGTLNSVQRNAYGSNNWGTSAVRRWLNSALGANLWWAAQTVFDLPPAYANAAGFLNGLDPAFVAVLGETDHVTVNNAVTDGGAVAETRSYVTRDKIYLPSITEIYGMNEYALAPEGVQYPYYAGTVDADKIKYDIAAQSTARYWWVRSPRATGAHIVRVAYYSTGALTHIEANLGYGAGAACVIL